jgi:hypothetical protein
MAAGASTALEVHLIRTSIEKRPKLAFPRIEASSPTELNLQSAQDRLVGGDLGDRHLP